MSTGFDESVETSWGRFEDELMAAVAAIGDGTFRVDVSDLDVSGLVPDVWFAGEGDWIRVEVCVEADQPPFTLSVEQENSLAAIGWHLPVDPDHECWWFETPRDEAELLRSMVTETFRLVFGVVHPRFLESSRLWPSAEAEEADVVEDDEVPVFDAPVIGFPENAEELAALVRGTLRKLHGAEVTRDGDGDFPIDTGVVPLWVHVMEDGEMLRVFSYVVRSVRDLRQARIEVDILNRRTRMLKFHIEDGVIIATYDLLAAPFVAPQLLEVLDRAALLLNDLAADAAVRVGGKLWFDGRKDLGRSSDVDETA